MHIPHHDHRVETAAGSLFARRWAADRAGDDKPAILLLHDSLGCVQLWRDFPARLASLTGHEVLAYDRLGFGQSDPHPGTLDASFITDEAHQGLTSVRQAFGIERMIVVGHSVGGGMALATGAALPDATAGIVAMSAQSFVEDHTLEGVRVAKRSFGEPGQIERLARYHGDKARWVLDAWIDTWLNPAFGDWSLDDALRRIRCPIGSLHGDRDEYGSAAHQARIAALAPVHTDLVLMEDCGHVPWREKPDQTLDIIGRFIDGLDQPRL